MRQINKSDKESKEYPIRILQFGEGNFLRAFVDYMIDIANEKELFKGSVAVVRPIKFGSIDEFRNQDCRYTVMLRGLVNKKRFEENRVISSISKIFDCTDDYEDYMDLSKCETLKYIVSNTTEAGIVLNENDKLNDYPPSSFPAKITQFLYNRATYFNFAQDKGCVLLPVELIDDNGDELKRCVLRCVKCWNLENKFAEWLENTCVFCNTLVDRIVTGYPKEEIVEIEKMLGYEDKLLVTAEPFSLWVIECRKDIQKEFPLDMAIQDKDGMDVIFTNNQKPYKQRKVRILNGAHTAFCLVSYLSGNNTVLESMNDKEIYGFIQNVIYKEVIPTLNFPEIDYKQSAQYIDTNAQNIGSLSQNSDDFAQDIDKYAQDVVQRFANPYINHALLSISLNSVSKWKTRCLPSLISYYENKKELPKNLLFSLAGLFCFYTSSKLKDKALIGNRDDEEYFIIDDLNILEFFQENLSKRTEDLVKAFFKENNFFGVDLLMIPNLEKILVTMINDIKIIGVKNAMRKHFLVGC